MSIVLSSRIRWFVAGLAVSLAVGERASSQTQSWTGTTDAIWETETNWNAAVPTAGDVAAFDAGSQANLSITLSASTAVRGLELTAPAGPVTIAPLDPAAPASLTLGTGGIAMAAATQDLSLTAGITIGNGFQTWDVAAGRAITAAAVPFKDGRGPNSGATQPGNAGTVQFNTTGTISLGVDTVNLITDNQGNPWATFGPNDWAGTSGGVVVASSYADIDGVTNPTLVLGEVNSIMADVVWDSSAGGTADVAALRWNEATPYTLQVGSGRTITGRGILITENSGGGGILPTGSGGFLRPNRSAVANTSFNIINHGGDFTIGLPVVNASSGAATQVVKSGAGTIIFTGENSNSGGTTINAGAIQIGDGGESGRLSDPNAFVANEGRLVYNRTGTIIHDGLITGSGSVELIADGTLTLGNAANSYSGGTTATAGTLTYSTGLEGFGTGTLTFDGGTFMWPTGGTADLSSRTVAIGTGGLALDPNGNAVTLANPMAAGSSGGLSLVGPGEVTLAAANTFSGPVAVAAGTLLVANTAGSATGTGPVTVSGSGLLGGTGSVAGGLTIDAGGNLAPGAGVGTLTVGGLSLASDANLLWEFGSSSNDLVAIDAAGSLEINGGSMSLYDEGTTDPFSADGVYNIFEYGGTISGAGLGSLAVANAVPGRSYSFDQAGGFVTLTIAQDSGTTGWAVDADGGWGTAGNWSNGVPSGPTAIAGFGSVITADRTVTLDTDQVVGSMLFDNANAYTIASTTAETLTLGDGVGQATVQVQQGDHLISAPVVLASTGRFDVGDDQSLTLSGPVSSFGGLEKTSGGDLILAATNTYFGDTTVSGGSVEFVTGAIPSVSITLAGGGLRYADGTTEDLSGKLLTFGDGGGTIDTNGNDVTYANGIGNFGSGGFTKAGAGTLTLQAASSYSGSTAIAGGVLSIAADAALGDATAAAPLTLAGGTLEATAAITSARNVNVTGSSGIAVVNAADTVTFDGVFDGPGAVTKTGEGSLNLNGASVSLATSWSGGLTISAGTVSLGGGQGNGFNGLGSGPVTLENEAVLNLNGANGTFNSTSWGNLSNELTVAEGATAVMNAPPRYTWTGPVNGSGQLTVNVRDTRGEISANFAGLTGTLVLAPNETIGSGEFRLNRADVNLGNAQVDLQAGVTMVKVTNGPRTGEEIVAIGQLSGGGTLTGQPIAGRFTNFHIGGRNTDSTFDGTIVNNPGQYGDAEPRITKTGTGTLTLTNFSTYTGTTTVNQGTLAVTGDISASALTTATTEGTLAGTGYVGALTVDAGGTIAPGDGIGTIYATGDTTLAGGGNYNFEINDATGFGGTSWDQLTTFSGLAITATAENPFTFNLWSRTTDPTPTDGEIANFDPSTSYSWTVASSGAGVTGFDPSFFNVVTAPANGTGGFSNDLDFGSFSVAVSGNDLQLVFTPGEAPTDIIIDVPSGSQTQAEAGYPTIAAADSVTKIGAGTVVFDAANAYAGPTTISAGTLEVANADALGATNVTVDSGATLAIAAGTTTKAPTVIIDGGTLEAAAVAVNNTTGIASLAINAGGIAGAPTVDIAAGGEMALVQDARVTAAVGGLSVDESGTGGRLDVGSGLVTIAAGGITAADLRADIIAGRNNGAWNSPTGIMSSAAAASGGSRAVGYLVGGDGSASVSFAAPGDTDLNGQVNVFDLIGIDSAGKFGNGQAADWSQGDFNYDGVANVFDLIAIDSSGAYGAGNYFPAGPTALGGGMVAAVPEPATLLWAAAGLAGLAVARRRRRTC